MQVENQTRNTSIQWILVLYCLPCTNLHFTARRTKIARKTYLWQLLNKYIPFLKYIPQWHSLNLFLFISFSKLCLNVECELRQLSSPH